MALLAKMNAIHILKYTGAAEVMLLVVKIL
jgi:hypothetical protein